LTIMSGFLGVSIDVSTTCGFLFKKSISDTSR